MSVVTLFSIQAGLAYVFGLFWSDIGVLNENIGLQELNKIVTLYSLLRLSRKDYDSMTVAEFNKCVSDLTDGLFRFVVKNTRDVPSAEDIVQESFVRLWENRDKVVFGSSKSYLYTIAYRLLVDRGRRRSVHNEVDVSVAAGIRNSEEHHPDLDGIIASALGKLRDDWRMVVLLRDMEGYSYEEIAEITGCTLSQVKVNIFRGRSRLRDLLGSLDDII